jgi:hypothetical protein
MYGSRYAAPEHVHAAIAKGWWEQETGSIAFCRLTQLGFFRLMTTAAVMHRKPLTMTEAWRVFLVPNLSRYRRYFCAPHLGAIPHSVRPMHAENETLLLQSAP